MPDGSLLVGSLFQAEIRIGMTTFRQMYDYNTPRLYLREERAKVGQRRVFMWLDLVLPTGL